MSILGIQPRAAKNNLETMRILAKFNAQLSLSKSRQSIRTMNIFLVVLLDLHQQPVSSKVHKIGLR
jgi:hypothetical protein